MTSLHTFRVDNQEETQRLVPTFLNVSFLVPRGFLPQLFLKVNLWDKCQFFMGQMLFFFRPTNNVRALKKT